ncbi:MAG: hypothetical protein ACOH2E_00375 [Candidatus Paracaedibacter sp.]
MDISLFLSKALGLYLVIISVGMLINAHTLKPILGEMLKSPGLMFVTGVIAMIIGVLIVISHNFWTLDWRVIITIIGWASLIKGTIRVVIPQYVNVLDKNWMLSNTSYYTTFIITFLLGVSLCYFGAVHNTLLGLSAS